MTSGKNIKKMIGTDVGNKWGNKANNKPLLECNLQFFGDKNGGKGSINSANGLIGHDFEEYLTKKLVEMVHLAPVGVTLMVVLAIVGGRLSLDNIGIC